MKIPSRMHSLLSRARSDSLSIFFLFLKMNFVISKQKGHGKVIYHSDAKCIDKVEPLG